MSKIVKEFPVKDGYTVRAGEEKDHSSFIEVIQRSTFVVSRQFVGRQLFC